ncbi:hypothetical protein SKAU_G00100630 [Synaphobranchus kaupii]|uniref:Uncharacterized protein n=1 Tax=Synaphobranchus kaupii TaxID=118154 RepID=A0A9Q1J580_SYNKA|nr:hypothetical protein SKAU_G00100630 [Synaphobranchus kaupii]
MGKITEELAAPQRAQIIPWVRLKRWDLGTRGLLGQDLVGAHAQVREALGILLLGGDPRPLTSSERARFSLGGTEKQSRPASSSLPHPQSHPNCNLVVSETGTTAFSTELTTKQKAL